MRKSAFAYVSVAAVAALAITPSLASAKSSGRKAQETEMQEIPVCNTAPTDVQETTMFLSAFSPRMTS